MLTALLVVVRQLLRQRGRHTFIPTPPTFRCTLMPWVMFADYTLMLQQRYAAKNQLTYPPKPPTLPPVQQYSSTTAAY